MNPSSIAPSRSWLKTDPLSSMVTLLDSSLSRATISSALRSPSSSRNTAAYLSIVAPSSSRTSDTRRPSPLRSTIAWMPFSSSASSACGTSGVPLVCATFAAWRPARLPKISVSSSELAPSRLPPCTETQAHSPAAYRPGTSVSPSWSVFTPPIV
jgi:hypothetical protein